MNQESYMEWVLKALGMRYTFLLPAAALLAFVVVLVLLWRGKGNALNGALLFIVPLPVLIGCIGTAEALVDTLHMASVMNAVPHPSEWARGISMSLMSTYVGMIFTIPAFLLAASGLVVRSFRGEVAARRSHAAGDAAEPVMGCD